MLILTMWACAAHPPVVFATQQLERPAEPEPVAFEAAGDECVQAAAYKPGAPPPFLDGAGSVSCRAQVVPESQIVAMLQAQNHAAYWGRVANACHNGREADRAHAQLAVELQWHQTQASRADATAAKMTGAALFVVGVGVGLGAAAVAP